MLAAARGDARTLTLAEIEGLCGEWYRQQMRRYGDEPGRPDDWFVFVSIQEHKWEGDEHPDENEATPDSDDHDDARALLAGAGIRADNRSARRLAARLARSKLKFGQEMQGRLAGREWSRESPSYPPPPKADARPAPVAAAANVSFGSLLDGYGLENQRNARARYDRERTLERLKAFLGHDDAARVTADDAIRFKDARVRQVANATVRNDLSELSGIWRWAVRNRKVAANPFLGISPPKSRGGGKRTRVPYDEDDARRILEAARRETGLLRWLPWLLCFTGARIGELAQAAKADLAQRDGGLWVLRIHGEAEGNTLKTLHSERLVPLHHALVAEGFVQYVTALPAGSRLWPKLKPNMHGLFGDYASKEHGRWVRGTVGITDTRKDPAHAWRHRFEDEARRAHIPQDVRDGILGHHNPKNEGEGYGHGHRFMPDVTGPHLARMRSPVDVAT